MTTCEEIIHSKISYGKYHILLFVAVGLILLADGSETLALSLMLPSVIKEWNLDAGITYTISSIYYFGVLIGSLFGGIIADQIGRRKIFLITTLFTALFGFTAFFIYDLYIFLIIRGFFGILIGIVSPLSICIISENFPTEIRGKAFILCRIGKMIGELFAAIIGYIYLDNSLTSGNWRALILWSATPAFLSFIISYFYLIESPRYLFSKNMYILAYEKIKEIRKINTNEVVEISTEEDRIIRNFYYDDAELELDTVSNKFTIESIYSKLSQIFSKKYFSTTLLVWGLWLSMIFVFYGQSFILPIILSKFPPDINNTSFFGSSFSKIIIPILAEIPAAYLCSLMIENSYFGRKNSLIYAFTLSGISYSLCFFAPYSYFVFYLSIARFLLVMGYSIKYTYTSELYHTNIRSTGVGAASAFGRFGGIFMPIILIKLVEYNPYYPFLCFFGFCLFGALCCYNFPFDTLNRELDKEEILLQK